MEEHGFYLLSLDISGQIAYEELIHILVLRSNPGVMTSAKRIIRYDRIVLHVVVVSRGSMVGEAIAVRT